MESSKPAQNIQDSFLNTARKERLSITIYLLSGVKLTGRIRSFDKYSVVLGGQRTGTIDLQARYFDRGDGPDRRAQRTPAASGSKGGSRARGVGIALGSGLGRQRFGHRRVRRFRLAQFSSQEDPQSRARSRTCASWR